MKAFFKRLGVGFLCGLGALALCLILLSFTIGNGTLYVSFPAVVRFFGTDSAKAVYLAAVLLFLCYGGVGAICRTIFLSERLSLFTQCICAFLPTAAALLLTAFLCGKLTPPMLLAILIGCAVLYAAIWGLRTWRWKCRVGEINLLLPEASRQRRTLWGAALGAFCSTVLLWSIAVLFGAAAMLLLML